MIQDLATKEGKQLLKDNYIGHLSYIYGEWPFSIPITYYYIKAKNIIISYAAEGHKIKAMRKNPNVSLEVNEIDSVNHWRSVLVHGKFEELEGVDAKYYLHEFCDGVKELLLRKEKKHAKSVGEFSSKMDSKDTPIVYKIVIDDMTAKFRED